MTKNLVWRLQEKPTTEDITRLIEAGVITKQEAKDVFFREEEKPKKATPSELDSVREEMKLLRELVLEIGKHQPTWVFPYVIEKVKYVPTSPWVQPYIHWCGATYTSNASQLSNYSSTMQTLGYKM